MSNEKLMANLLAEISKTLKDIVSSVNDENSTHFEPVSVRASNEKNDECKCGCNCKCHNKEDENDSEYYDEDDEDRLIISADELRNLPLPNIRIDIDETVKNIVEDICMEITTNRHIMRDKQFLWNTNHSIFYDNLYNVKESVAYKALTQVKFYLEDLGYKVKLNISDKTKDFIYMLISW